MTQFGKEIEMLLAGRKFTSKGPDFEVEIEKDNNPEPNRAIITVFNPNDQLVARARELGNDELVEISAALVGNFSLAFRGSPIPDGVSDSLGDVNRELEIEVADGGYEWRATRVNTSFKGGSSAEEIIRFCADKFGFPIRRLELPNNYSISYGAVLSGSVADIMTRTVNSAGAQWSLQDQELVVVPENETSGRTAPVFSGENGTLLSTSETEKGADSEVLFTNPVNPEDPYKLDSEVTPGFFKAQKVTTVLHSGEGEAWDQEIEGVSLG